MSRVPFSQVLKQADVDYRIEYIRLYELFYRQKVINELGRAYTIKEYCAANFMRFPFRGTCISLDDFDKFYGYQFQPNAIEFDNLVSFCEYSYNLALHANCFGGEFGYGIPTPRMQPIQIYIYQVEEVIDKIGYMPNRQNGITDFVPKDQAAISVAEIIDSVLSYRVIEYNHHSMKGDLSRKRNTLLALADRLEAQRNKLKEINKPMESDLFYLFNKMNIRHNNADSHGEKYEAYIANMSKETLENWYDDTYQMCLLAFLELEHLERKGRVKELRESIEQSK